VTFPVSLRWLIGFIFSAVAFAGSYTVSVIPPPSGIGTAVFGWVAINNSGQVAGSALTEPGQAIIGSTSSSTLIPFPQGWDYSSGSAINNSGQVAGSGFDGSYQAFIGTSSGMQAIPLPSGYTLATGQAINDSGQVAGTAFQAQAYIGTTSGSTVIPLPVGWSGAYAFGINASGQVTGYVLSVDDNLQAFIGTTSGSTVIPLPAGWGSSYGEAINDSGQVAGFGENVNGEGNNLALIGTTSGATVIPLPAGATSAWVSFGSINNSGVVAGISDAGGWIWSASGGTQLLTGLIPAGWSVSSAISISQNGIILAEAAYNGGATQYVELIPAGSIPATPAPASGFLALTGVLLIFAWRFRSHARNPRR
jgi:hypothetical protein